MTASDPAAISVGLCWGTAINATLPELIDAAGAGGFATITVSNALLACAQQADMTVSQVRTRLADAGVSVAYIDPLLAGLPGTPPLERVRSDLQQFFRFGCEEVLEAAAALGASAINVAHFLGDPATPRADLASRFAEIAHSAAALDLKVLVEFIPGTGIHDLAAAAELVASCKSSNVQITLDTWHFARSGSTIAQIEALPPGTIAGIQLSDWAPGERFRMMTGRRMPGTGTLPLAAIIGAAQRNNPHVHAMLEVLDAERARRPAREIASQAAEHVARWRQTLRASEAPLDR